MPLIFSNFFLRGCGFISLENLLFFSRTYPVWLLNYCQNFCKHCFIYSYQSLFMLLFVPVSLKYEFAQSEPVIFTDYENTKWRHLFIGYCSSRVGSELLGNTHLLLLALMFLLCWSRCWIYGQVCRNVHLSFARFFFFSINQK